MKFKVSDIAYFLVCNALKTLDKFDAKLQFELTLVPYKTDTSWVESKLVEMKSSLDSPYVPEINKYCEKCMYLDTGKNFI
jgi:hypothetical protein